MNRSKLIHIVGGGFNQVPLVKRAKALGMRVLVSDSNIDPPARAFADLYEQIDTTEREATLHAAEKHRIDFVTTDMTDVAVPTVAYVAEKLGLPGIGYETSLRFTNKHVMRSSLAGTLGKHVPESHFFAEVPEALEFLSGLDPGATYLVKPVNSQGSKGVSILEPRSAQNSGLVRNSHNESRGRGILIERYIRGFEYSVESFVRDSKVHNLTLTKKYHYAENPCLDERNTFLGDVDAELERELFRVNSEIIRTLGLPFGMTHAEYKIEDGIVYLMEIAARGAGGSISSHIVPYLTEFDTLNALLKVYTDQPFEIQYRDYKERFAVLKFYNFVPGRVKRIIHNPVLTQSALVFAFPLKEGDVIHPPRDSRDRTGYFVVHGPDRERVLQQEKVVESAVQIEYG